jgi:hypothetical protein
MSAFHPLQTLASGDMLHGMKRNAKVWRVIYGVAIVIFVGGILLDVQTSPYFTLFVLFCMLYGAAATALMMWPDRKSHEE